MAILDFKGRAQAEQWKRKLNELNNETDAVLGRVYSSIEEIKTESSGDFVEQLVTTAADMADAGAEMIKAMKSLESMVDTVIKKIADAIGEAVQNIVGKRTQATDL